MSGLPTLPLPLAGVLVTGGAVLTLAGEYALTRWLVYLFKPLTTLLILAVALGGTESPPFYRWMVAAGLVCSLVGDVLLMLPRDCFVAGLGAFFAAHLCYIAAFFAGGAPKLPLTVLLPLLAYAFVLLRLVSPGAGRLTPGVALYAGALAAMAWAATGRWTGLHTAAAGSAAAGALLFVASDSVLAVDRFRRRFHAAPLLVLATYYAAQWLIARST